VGRALGHRGEEARERGAQRRGQAAAPAPLAPARAAEAALRSAALAGAPRCSTPLRALPQPVRVHGRVWRERRAAQSRASRSGALAASGQGPAPAQLLASASMKDRSGEPLRPAAADALKGQLKARELPVAGARSPRPRRATRSRARRRWTSES